MKKFRFSLERVLRVRKIQEALRLAEHNRSERALRAQQHKLDMFTNEQEAQCQAMEAALLQEFRAGERQTDWKYLQRIERIVSYQSGVVSEYARHEAEARKQFILARQKSLGLEKLGDKRRDEWHKEFIDFEQKIVDDRPRSKGRQK